MVGMVGMVEFISKFYKSFRYLNRVSGELILDLYVYYTSAYPLFLALGAFRRLKRRLKLLWLPNSPGRPPTPENIVDLILDMKRSNLLWGTKRIRDELQLLGIFIHKKTIRTILIENGFTNPPMKFAPPTWAYLLDCHMKTWSMDFCNIINLNGFQLYVLVVIEHSSREIIWIAVTLNPTRDWLTQQFRNMSIREVELPDFMIIDNDGIYGKWIDKVLSSQFQIKVLRTDKGCPWQNGRVERFIKTLKLELLLRVPIHDTISLSRVCASYKSYFNYLRPHQGIGGCRPSDDGQTVPKVSDLSSVRYEKKAYLHGLFNQFRLVA
ncbi:integrase core domain-containing protein [Bdellovibrionales bacterium]|nr:integrase core domain-containing protein [Bdellovibrionales bacterium]